MLDIFALDNNDIKALGPQGLVDLMHLLVNNEARVNGIPMTGIDTSLAITVADGGIDSRATWTGGPERTDFLPSRYTGLQIKAGELAPGRMATDAVNLEVDPPRLKPQVKRIFDEGGAYIMIYGQDAPGENHDARVKAIREQVEPFLPHGAAPTIELYDASKIAAWASRFVHTFVFVASRTRRGLPNGTMLFSEWSSLSDHRHKFIMDEEIQAQLASIVSALEHDGAVVRIDGIPGLGKSRLAIEACRHFASAQLVEAIYIDAGGESSSDISAAVLGWRRIGAFGLIVVDNCPPDLHKKLEQLVVGTGLRLLTMDYTLEDVPPSSAQLRLRRRSDEVVRGILTDAYGQGLHSIELDRLVGFAYGSPRMARMIADAEIVMGGVETRLLPDSELIDRLIFGRSQPDAIVRRVLEALSIFEHIGRSGNVASHLEYLRNALLEDVSPVQFERILNQLQQREIVVKVGDYVRVSPPPMAVRLALRWFDTEPEGRRISLISDVAMPMGMVEMLCRQFRYLETVPRAAELAARLCEAQGPFGVAEVLQTRRGARIFRALAPLAPEAAASTLLREFGNTSTEELQSIKDARRDLLYAMEILAFNAALFVQVGFVIAAFARAENESYSNNATGILKGFFRAYLSGTEAGPEQRWRLIKVLEEKGWLELAIDCLSVAIADDRGWRAVGAEYQRGQALEDWSPASSDELKSYVSVAISHLLDLANNQELRPRIKRAIANGMRFLLRLGIREQLVVAVQVLGTEDTWREALESLRVGLKYDVEENEGQRQFVESLIEVLDPQDLSKQIQLLVSKPIADFDMSEGMVDLNEARRQGLLERLVSSGALIEFLPSLSFGEQGAGFEFGRRAGEQVPDIRSVIDASVVALRGAVGGGNPSFLGGLLSAAKVRAFDVYQETLDKLVIDPVLRRMLPWLTAVTCPTESDVLRLLPLVADLDIPANEFGALAYGRVLQGISAEAVKALISALLDRAAFHQAVMIAHMLGESGAPEVVAFELDRAFLEWAFVADEHTTFEDYSYRDELRAALRRSKGPDIARKITRDVLDIAAAKDAAYDVRSRASELLALVFELQQDEAWNVFLSFMASSEPDKKYWTVQVLQYIPAGATHHASPLLVVRDELLVKWMVEDPYFAPAYLAKSVRLFNSHESKMYATPLLLEILNKFGNHEHVRDSVLSNLISFGSIGSRVPYLEERLEFLHSLPDFDGPEAIAWKTEAQRYFLSDIERERRRDEEFRHGIF